MRAKELPGAVRVKVNVANVPVPRDALRRLRADGVHGLAVRVLVLA